MNAALLLLLLWDGDGEVGDPPIAGPFRSVAGQSWQAGSEEGQYKQPGSTAAQNHQAGSTGGQTI